MTEDMTAKVTYTDCLGNDVSVDGKIVRYSGDIYRIEVDTLAVADAFQDVTVTVYDGETVHGTATDSVESYVARARASTGSAGIFEAIIKFAASAKAYFG